MKIKYLIFALLTTFSGQLLCFNDDASGSDLEQIDDEMTEPQVELTLTPIGLAILDNDLVAVKELITTKKASVNDSANTSFYDPLLTQAIATYNRVSNPEFSSDPNDKTRALEIITFLLDHNAPVNKHDEQMGETPLFIAARSLAQFVTLLLDKGADINALDKNEETPLFTATLYNHPEIVKLLLDRGAKPSMANIDGYTPYSLTNTNDKELEKHFLDNYGVEIKPAERSKIKNIFDEYFKAHRLPKVLNAEKEKPSKSFRDFGVKFE